MALLRAFEDHGYWPEYSTFLLRDAGRGSPARVGGLLAEYAVRTAPCGSIARAGDGWVDAQAAGRYQHVRLEAHDDRPPPEPGWPELVETPFNTAGVVGLSMVASGVRDAFRLGDPGLYRLRLGRRHDPDDPDGSAYLLQFWPVEAPVDPPRWLARDHPLLRADRRADDLRDAVTDLVMLVLWAGESGDVLTVARIADRLQCPALDARAVLARAVADGFVTGYADQPEEEPLTLAVHGRPEPPPRIAAPPTQLVPRAAYSRSTAPEGPPPKAGFAGSGGELIVWRDGSPVQLAHWPRAQIRQAVQTRHGTVLLAADHQAALIRPDGEFVLLGTAFGGRAHVDDQGERLALTERHVGRSTWFRIHCFDLADGTDHTMPPGRIDGLNAATHGIIDGRVHASIGRESVTWRPGSEEPMPLPYRLRQLDPHSATILAQSPTAPTMLVCADGGPRPLDVDPVAGLAPGGRWLHTWDHDPPALVLYDLPDPSEARRVALPRGSAVGPAGGVVWEDATHILVPAQYGANELGVPLARVDVVSGAFEAVALPAAGQSRPTLVEPLWTA
ncbi:hypothetical protein Dvina_36925 [Dactylosporangium vinaceum]|uniref:Uncharacterized protein n=1 Tax=Dactylosporangium vinaceum TaxID=53362 RepID=A0ABV5MIU9_9ACTN|nr:hypothetical protein [Dactylosporangium vinaceum]UAB93760.1 hypothetical protein Dvina_36925 [Dactylosporangium vinaceum]